LQQSDEADGHRDRDIEKVLLPTAPKIAWIERDDCTEHAAGARKFEDQPCSHRTADCIDADEILTA
jgi:hypothetical protein